LGGLLREGSYPFTGYIIVRRGPTSARRREGT